MQAKPKHLYPIISLVISLVLLAASVGSALFVRDNGVTASPSGEAFKGHTVEINPGIRRLDTGQETTLRNAGVGVKAVLFACQSNTNPQPVLCYGPYQIRQAYGMSSLIQKGITGKGTSITIIDAYGSPTIREDLQRFDKTWNIPNPLLHIIAPFGVKGADSTWASETSLDVQWAHALAPSATINLVLAKTSDDADLYAALAYSVKRNLGDVISLSFGENEHCVDPKLRLAEHNILREAAQKRITVLAATGDVGSAQLTCNNTSYQEAASFPADDPQVTAVGGTMLRANAATGRYISESAWNESSAFNKATGGGYSTIYTAPSYQRGIPGATRGRGEPDLALNASVSGGVLVYQGTSSSGKPIVNIMGGTSVGTPEMAGILADGVQLAHHRLGTMNAALYKIGHSSLYHQAMHDVTSGNNALTSAGLPGYRAATGWDPATGWGSLKDGEVFLYALIAGG